MIFPQHNYQEFNSTNRKDWAVDDWSCMVNEAQEYCKSMTDMHEYVGKCRAVDLPSFHPYWRGVVSDNLLDFIECIKGQIAQTEAFITNNPTNSRIASARMMVDRYKAQLELYSNSTLAIK